MVKNSKNETALHYAHSAVVGRKLASAYRRVLEERKVEAAAAEAESQRQAALAKASRKSLRQQQRQRLLKSQSVPEKLVSSTPPSLENSPSPRRALAATSSPDQPRPPFSPSALSSSMTANTSALASSSSLSDDAYYRLVERLYRAIGDGDEQLVRHFMGWDWDESVPSDFDSSSPSAYQRELCHPLCDCVDCRPIQRQIAATMKSGLTVSCANREGE